MCDTEHQKDLALWILSVAVSLGAMYFLCQDLLLAAVVTSFFAGCALTPPGEAAWLWLLGARRPTGQEIELIEAATMLLRDVGVEIPRGFEWRILDDPARRTYAFMRHIVLASGMLEMCDSFALAESLREQFTPASRVRAARGQCAWGCMAGTLSLLLPWAVYTIFAQAVYHYSPSGSQNLAGAVAFAIFGFLTAVVLWMLAVVLMVAFRLIVKGLTWMSGAFLVGTGPGPIEQDSRIVETAD